MPETGGLGAGTPGPGPPEHAVTLLLSSVTDPFRARALPFRLAPVFRVMLERAMMFPTMDVVVPRVAELVTWNHTPQASAPFVSEIDEPLAVVRELPTWKMYTPAPTRVRFPVSCAVDAKQ
jgi:hypothetical protein